MTSIHLFINGNVKKGGQELIQEWEQHPDSVIWLDSYEMDKDEEAELLKSVFGIHQLAIQDAQRDRHPPKIEAFDNYTFILLRGLTIDSVNIDFKTIQLALFVGQRFLVTRHNRPSISISQLSDELAQQDTNKNGYHADKLALRICRLMANRYLKILLELEPRLEAIEEQIMSSPNDDMLAELIGYKSDLKRLNRMASYHQGLFNTLKKKNFPCFNDEDRHHEIIDVWENHERAESLSQLYYETAADLIDGYISVASHRLNQIMKVLTIVTSIFIPLGFLAGIYGMNFENIPELHSQSGYFILLAVMASIVVALLIVFRKIRWL